MITKHGISGFQGNGIGKFGLRVMYCIRTMILLNGSPYGMTFFRNCWEWPSELWARTQRSRDLILDVMRNPTQYLRQQPSFYKMFQGSFLTRLPVIASTFRGAAPATCGWNVSSDDTMKLLRRMFSCVTLLLQPGSWHETMSLSCLNPARKPSTPLLHLCTLFLQMRRLGGYLSSNVSIWAGFSRAHSAVFRGYECLSQRNLSRMV